MKNVSVKQIGTMASFECKNRLKVTVIWALAMAGIMILYMGLFPYIKDMALEKFSVMPQELLAAFGMDQTMNLTDYNGYFTMIFNIINIILAIGAAMRGATILHDEESQETIEYLYGNSVSRHEIFISKAVSIVAIDIFITIFTGIGIFATDFADGTSDLCITGTLWILFFSLVLQLTFSALGLFIATIAKKTAKAGNTAISVMLATYIIGYMSSINIEKLEFLKYFSPIHYLSPSMIMNSQFGLDLADFDIIGPVISTFIIIVLCIVAGKLFIKKDLC